MSDKDQELIRTVKARQKQVEEDTKQDRSLWEEVNHFAEDFTGDYQWPQDVRDLRRASKPPRPCLVMNKIPERLAQTKGDFLEARPSDLGR